MLINSQAVLVVGGAGYIGSHMVLMLKNAGMKVVVLDNLSRGHRHAIIDTELIVGDMGEVGLLEHIFKSHAFSTVMHFASFMEVEESVKFPAKYYQNNVSNTLNLLQMMLKYGVKQLVFSSSATVYGEPQTDTIAESHPLLPIHPYGRSKLMVEEIIKDVGKSDGLNYAILRYFNAAGADPYATIGERHHPESHLIPLVLQVAAGKKPFITVHGNAYATADGTCVRDYIHVNDICQAHLLAMLSLDKQRKNILCNLGTGSGHSVLQVIETAKQITQKEVPYIIGSPRQGDVVSLVANAKRAKEMLAWYPKHSDLSTIISHAWRFALSFS